MEFLLLATAKQEMCRFYALYSQQKINRMYQVSLVEPVVLEDKNLKVVQSRLSVSSEDC